jgi:hypothetical protein
MNSGRGQLILGGGLDTVPPDCLALLIEITATQSRHGGISAQLGVARTRRISKGRNNAESDGLD